MRVAGTVCAVLAVVLSVSLRADVTITQTITFDGPAMAAAGQSSVPRMVTRIKGTKARTEIAAGGRTEIALIDLSTNRVIRLNPADRTAQMFDRPAAGAAAPAASDARPAEVAVKPTGQQRTIDGVPCDDYAMEMTVAASDALPPGIQVPPEAGAALKDVQVVLNGTSCVARSGPGIDEFLAFQKGGIPTLTALLSVGLGAGSAATFERLLTAVSSMPGLARLTEITVSFQGGGQVGAMLQQIGTMKLTMRVTDVSVDPLADDLFTVPADYKIVK